MSWARTAPSHSVLRAGNSVGLSGPICMIGQPERNEAGVLGPFHLRLIVFRADDIRTDWSAHAGFNPTLPFPIGDKDMFARLASALKYMSFPVRQPVEHVYV